LIVFVSETHHGVLHVFKLLLTDTVGGSHYVSGL
jgi:hypothetical protein